MDSDEDPIARDRLQDEFIRLLDARQPEQVYQTFLEEHTQFVPREFVQNHGLHFSLILRKLGFAKDYSCDFFYMSKSSDDWNLVFVEIEKPQSRFFHSNSNRFHTEFNAALQQIGQWRAWLSEPANLAAFLKSIDPIRLPHIMRGNPSFPKFVLVHGRRNEYASNDQRRAMIRAQERDDFKILTFDSLAENVSNKFECYIAVRYNECIRILGDRLLPSTIFGWIDPSQFIVSKALQTAIRAGESDWPKSRRSEDGKTVDAHTYVASRIKVIENGVVRNS